MTKARDIADFKFEDIVDTGTAGTKVASGTTAQRGSTTGQWRYNTETGFFEGRNASTFSTLEPTPSVTSVDVTDIDSSAGGSQTFVITGANLSSGGTISFVGNDNSEFNADSTTFNSTTQVTATKTKASFLNAKEPYSIKFTSVSGKAGISGSGLISVDTAPSWTTAAGNLGNVYESQNANLTVAASDAEGDTIAYTETGGTVLASNGFSLNSASGLISGTAPSVSGDTTINFDLRATANSKNTDRAFNIIIKAALGSSANPATSAKQLYDAGYTSNGVYYFNNVWTGNQNRQAYARMDVVNAFNTNKLHLQRIDFGHLSAHAIRTYTNSGSLSLTHNSGNATDSMVGSGSSTSSYYYNASSNTGGGVSGVVDTGLRLTDFQGNTVVQEMYQASIGDGGNTVGTMLDFHSSTNGGNYGHVYHGDTYLMNTYNQSVDYFIQAIKFTNSSGSTIIERDDYLGGQYRDGDNADVWTALYNQSGTSGNSGGSDSTIGTAQSSEYIGVRFRGWADHSANKTAHYAFWIGINGS